MRYIQVGKLHSVALNRELCVGCTNCIKGCPTQAIRVRDGKAVIDETRCIDCGECIRICPHHAKGAVTDPFPDLSAPHKDHPTAVLIPPSLYAQFGPPATRGMILKSMYSLGFDYVYEVALGAAVSSARTRELLQEKRELVKTLPPEEASQVFPLISSACPVVVRLIQMKYKALIPHLVPLDSPMEITARYAREDISNITGLPPENIVICFLAPCPSKRSVTLNPQGQKKSDVNYVIALNEVYPLILNMLEKSLQVSREELQASSKVSLAESCGVQWGASGGEASTLGTEKYMAVDGIHNVISIFEEIENENLTDIEFIEPSCCFGGCIGGPLTVSNPFTARARMRGFVRAAKEEQDSKPDLFMKPGVMNPLLWEVPLSENNAMRLDENIEAALGKYDQMEQILATLPGLDCGACGAPTCAALAEDIVQGNALETDCIIKLKEHIRKVAREINILDL